MNAIIEQFNADIVGKMRETLAKVPSFTVRDEKFVASVIKGISFTSEATMDIKATHRRDLHEEYVLTCAGELSSIVLRLAYLVLRDAGRRFAIVSCESAGEIFKRTENQVEPRWVVCSSVMSNVLCGSIAGFAEAEVSDALKIKGVRLFSGPAGTIFEIAECPDNFAAVGGGLLATLVLDSDAPTQQEETIDDGLLPIVKLDLRGRVEVTGGFELLDVSKLLHPSWL